MNTYNNYRLQMNIGLPTNINSKTNEQKQNFIDALWLEMKLMGVEINQQPSQSAVKKYEEFNNNKGKI